MGEWSLYLGRWSIKAFSVWKFSFLKLGQIGRAISETRPDWRWRMASSHPVCSGRSWEISSSKRGVRWFGRWAAWCDAPPPLIWILAYSGVATFWTINMCPFSVKWRGIERNKRKILKRGRKGVGVGGKAMWKKDFSVFTSSEEFYYSITNAQCIYLECKCNTNPWTVNRIKIWHYYILTYIHVLYQLIYHFLN